MIWRNRPGTGRTNCEQWGALRASDSDCDSEMKSELHPDRPYAVFDHIQVTLFRGGPRKGDRLRSGVATNDAQVGILNVSVGITSRADFTLDYTVDTNDLAVWTAHAGTTCGATLREGDADNDTDVDLIWNTHGSGRVEGMRRTFARP